MFRKLVIPICSLLATVAIAADQPVAAAKATTKAPATKAPATKAPAPKATATKAESEYAATASTADAKALSGMSILGNQEAPKALVIVPWKSSQLGDALGIAKDLDDGRQPVDKEVFMRQLSYYAIRAQSQ
jgi:hypothetical protein